MKFSDQYWVTNQKEFINNNYRNDVCTFYWYKRNSTVLLNGEDAWFYYESGCNMNSSSLSQGEFNNFKNYSALFDHPTCSKVVRNDDLGLKRLHREPSLRWGFFTTNEKVDH